ncbi:MAG: sugar phosphate isomerase/epimerase [Candidatus Omnitrophota bacterium]|nr:sugar phosphate isomerase/epimerase [Candidatus Omnitrophota bacterium]MDZ4241712.1 sugar phosphate isomerase/epimerase [Candidatus Omnitrophota bacterium]
MLAISTAWNYESGGDVRQMLAEIKETGVDAIELGYRVVHQDLEKIIPLLGDLGLTVSSVHNFCPVPHDGPSPRHPSNYYRLSAVDDDERKKAVQWTQQAIDTAVRTAARVVVIHAGSVELPEDPSCRLLEMWRQGQGGTEEFAVLREAFLKSRREHRGPYMDSVIRSLRDVMAYASGRGILIGLETRYYPTEIPNCDEVGELLELFHGQGMGYWHDVGHAEVNGRLGLAPHARYLEKYRDRLIGFHLHGVKILKDHQAPLEGDFDLLSVSPYLSADKFQVIESHATATPEQMKAAVRTLRPLCC